MQRATRERNPVNAERRDLDRGADRNFPTTPRLDGTFGTVVKTRETSVRD